MALNVCKMLTLAAVTVVAGACGGDEGKAAAPAKVQNAVTEAQLTTVTLTPEAVRRLGILTAAVESLTVLPTRTVGGEVVVPPGLSVTISAPTAGTVLAPENADLPGAGTRVTQGTTLMRLAPLNPDAGQTERDYQVAAARLKQAQAEADRTARLFADRLVSARENDAAQTELTSARATAEAAAAQLRLVRGGGVEAGLATLRVPSPTDGIVRGLHVASGQTVAAGTPLVDVMRTDRLWVRVPLYAGDARRIRRGAPATVHDLAGPQSGPVILAGPVTAPPSADAAASSVDLFYELRGPTGSLRPGERVGVTLPLATDATAQRELVVPLASLVRDLSGGSWVYERRDSVTFVRRRVDVTRVSGAYAILASGPRVGTIVVTAGTAELFGTEFGAGK